jgi:hypothetical protein
MNKKYSIKLSLDNSGLEYFVCYNEQNQMLCYANQSLQDYNICYEENTDPTAAYRSPTAFRLSFKLNMIIRFCEMLCNIL